MNKRIWSLLVIFVTLTVFFLSGNARAQEARRSIVKIAGDLYRFQNNTHFSVFLVTREGIIATDPINAGAAQWLKAEIDRRFSRPVKYVIYSHHHPDHVSGGSVFADTAIFVAHEKTKPAILAGQRQGFPPPIAAMDANGNGAIEREEGRGRLLANFDRIDTDKNGIITVAEFAAQRGGNITLPNVLFSDRMTIELGGRIVELTYVGRNHSDNSIVMRFPKERTLFAVDFITVKRLPFRNLGDSFLPDWIDSLKNVEQMDFDILTPGHGVLGIKADVRDNRAYLEDLSAAVLKLAAEGKSLQDMQRIINLEKYKDWGQYEAWLPLNIEGAYNLLVK
jgi:glyoxylase-like metal-dependent hydrolase (beta-lactamase superfamily II)